MEEFILVAIFVIGVFAYGQWKERHPERIQAREQEVALKNAMEKAERLATAHNGLAEFHLFEFELRRDLKFHIFLSDSYNHQTIDVSNLSAAPNANVTLAIIFFYIGNMPKLIKENGMTYSDELKKELVNQLVKMELNTSYFGVSAQGICITAFNNYKGERKS